MRKKPLYDVDRLLKSIWYDPAMLDNRLSQNVQDIRLSHKVYGKYHRKLESRTDCRRKKLNWGENPDRDLLGKYAITISICKSDEATHWQFRKYTVKYKFHKSQETISHLKYMNDIIRLAKNEKGFKALIEAKRIYSKDIRMEFALEKYVMLIMKSGKLYRAEEIELQSPEKQNTRRNWYLQILENIGSGHH